MGGRAGYMSAVCLGLRKGAAERLRRNYPVIQGLGRVRADTLAPGREKASTLPARNTVLVTSDHYCE